jgi:HEAT repeat protein
MDSHRKRIQELIQELGHRDAHIRRQALWQLGNEGDLHALLIKAQRRPNPAAVGGLCEALRDPNRQVCRTAASALAAIAEHDPTPAMRAALPRLHQLASKWFVDYDYLDYVELLLEWLPEHEKARQLYRSALEQIEAATAQTDLPLPAAAPRLSPHDLPVPAAPPAGDPASLPIPADAAAPRTADAGRKRNLRSACWQLVWRWRCRFRSLLRRGGANGA